MTTHLVFMEQLEAALREQGTARLVYATAEKEPYSAQQRPDVVFVPRGGAYLGQTIFIELDWLRNVRPTRFLLRAVEDNRKFVAEYLEAQVARYFYATSAPLDEFTRRKLLDLGLEALDGIGNPEDLKSRLMGLLGVEVPRR